jgi:hypothetical protein
VSETFVCALGEGLWLAIRRVGIPEIADAMWARTGVVLPHAVWRLFR